MIRPAAPVKIGSLDDALKYAEFLEAERDRLFTALSLAQTEIKGHMKTIDDLKADLADEAPARFRLQDALKRAQDEWQKAQSRIAELEKDAARYRFLAEQHNDWHVERWIDTMRGSGTWQSIRGTALGNAIDAARKDRA